MTREPTTVWAAPKGKAHVGRRGSKALCGFVLPRDARHWEINEANPAVLCQRCLHALREPGPWSSPAGWVRPPAAVEVYVGSPKQAWQLNELTWRRVVALGNGQRLTREAVNQVGVAAHEAMEDPARQHVARALGGNTFLAWAAMVNEGWCPDAAVDPDEDWDTTALMLAWVIAGEDDEV